MNKKISDFKDLSGIDEFSGGSLLFKNLKVTHFREGLDSNIVVCSPEYPMWQVGGVRSYIITNRNHILYVLLKTILRSHNNENVSEVYDFFKEEILKIHNEGRANKEIMNEMLLMIVSDGVFNFQIVEFLVKNGIVDVNSRTIDGRTLLMLVENKKAIDGLIALGCNVNAKLINVENKNHGKTAYDLAIKKKNKKVIEYLKPYMPKELVSKYNDDKLLVFKGNISNKRRFSLYVRALKENNLEIAYEILNNQEKYKKLIDMEEPGKGNLIHQAISVGNKDFLNVILDINEYKNNKDKLNFGQCYTTSACYKGNVSISKELFERGFFVKDLLLKYFDKNCGSVTIFNLMIDNDFNPNINCRLLQQSTYKLDEAISLLAEKEVDKFFSDNSYVLHLDNLKTYGKHIFTQTIVSPVVTKDIGTGTIKIVCRMLKKLKLFNLKDFKDKFDTFVRNIGINEENIAMKFSVIILSEFPEERDNILQLVGQDNAWISKIIKDDIKELLMRFENRESKRVRI